VYIERDCVSDKKLIGEDSHEANAILLQYSNVTQQSTGSNSKDKQISPAHNNDTLTTNISTMAQTRIRSELLTAYQIGLYYYVMVYTTTRN